MSPRRVDIYKVQVLGDSEKNYKIRSAPCLLGPPWGESRCKSFAACEGCVAGDHGGLCSHVFTLLMVLEKLCPVEADGSVPGSESVTSLPRSWEP